MSFDYSKGEFGLGQHELNVKYAEVLEMADRHSVYKQVHSPLTNKISKSRVLISIQTTLINV